MVDLVVPAGAICPPLHSAFSPRPSSHSPRTHHIPTENPNAYLFDIILVFIPFIYLFKVNLIPSPTHFFFLNIFFLGGGRVYLQEGRKEGSPGSAVCLFSPGRCSLGRAPAADQLAGERSAEHGGAWERPGPRFPCPDVTVALRSARSGAASCLRSLGSSVLLVTTVPWWGTGAGPGGCCWGAWGWRGWSGRCWDPTSAHGAFFGVTSVPALPLSPVVQQGPVLHPGLGL